MRKREISVCHQTWALLCKNFLKKWRKKRELFTEWFFTLLLLFILYLIPGSHHVNYFSQRPTIDLGQVDSFSDSDFIIAYAPLDKTTRQIMAKAASASFIKGEQIVGCPDEESMKELSSCHGGESISLQHREIVRVIFTTTHAYHLKFLLGRRIPIKKEHSDHTAHCYETYYNDECEVSKFWKKGFVALQAAINAAIIEITINDPVMEQLMSTTGKIMKIDTFIVQGGSIIDICLSLCVSSFSLVIYYVSINVTKERKKMKSLMTMMGLRESAFWLSWGLMYAGFIFIIALLMALILKSSQFVILSGFTVVFSLILLYGLSLIALAFLMSTLVKKAFITGLTVLLLNIFWGNLGLLALNRQLPTSLEWILSFLSPFAFMLGMSQLIHLDYDLNSNALFTLDFSNEIIATHFILVFDIFLYLALAIYFEKVLPNEYGHQYPPLFFLKSSFWSQKQKLGHVNLEDEIDLYCLSSDFFEPIPPEFHGKEAIRIRNVTKEYKKKHDKIEVLKDMVFDIYEGQITAILGHSGAGKSTLLNILSGLSIPTKGSVTIYNNKLSKMADQENISKFIGLCPQSNVQFDFLTVRENLRLFAKIKGIQSHEVDKEIQRVLLELKMTNIKNTLAQNLSGGQKRKLTLGIAILGDPQIFLLDEPTAGLDPYSRHQVWNLLKKWKTDRVILFSTHFMDEADILADRKVFLSKGQLKCAGSSLFLKKKWGIGYHLSLQLNEMCMEGKITSLIKQHIPDAKLSAASEGKLVYTLPLERTNRFPELFQNLESYPNLGIENYGVSMTTLNEVFLKLEGKSEERKQAGDPERLVKIEQILSSLNEMKKTIGGMALWRQQIWSVAKVRFLKLKHERRARIVLTLILAIGLCSFLLKYITVKVYQSSYVWELSLHSYFLAPGQPPRDPLTKLLIINNAGASIDDFIHSVERQNIALDVDEYGNKNGVDDLSYNGAIIVSGNEKNYSFSLVCNAKRLNCFPVLMDIVSNGLVGMVKQSDHIQTYRSTFWGEQKDMWFPHNLLMDIFPLLWHHPGWFVSPLIELVFPLIWFGLLWYLLAPIVAPTIALSSIDDFKIKVHSQLRISGLFPSAYWFGQALVDVPIYCLMFLFMYLMEYSLDHHENLTHVNKNIQIPCSIGYAISLIFLTYVIAFIFRKGRKNSGIWSLCFLVITGFSVFVIMLARDAFGYNTVYITFLIPLSALILPFFMYEPRPSLLSEEIMRTAEPFLIVLIPFLNFIIFVFILRCLEWKFGKKLMRKDPIFRISPRNNGVCQNPEDPEGEDEDVQMERERTASALSSINSDEKPVIIASCLRKEYRRRRKCCLFKKKIIATRNVSFCVRKGEVLGLLGHNGAGKSTSIKLITGDTQPTAGQVLLKGCSGTEPLGFLGYCPQENTLWPNLTVREHLEVFASVKGLRKADTTVAIARLVEVFKMQEELKLPVKNLSEGIKRKLCFALSILGNPSVVLLDEPSMGMDPKGQQQVWQAICATLKNTERGVLLTTHNMAEAEAVCDRVAIMVSGRLSCIGSIQYLKSKFGKDYLLEMKVKTPEHGKTLHAEILRLFPQAVQQERYSCLMAYKLPMEGVKPLAQAFFKLETVKQSFDLEEYSLSQSTLEEVFLELSKEQKLDEELHPSVKWKHLAQE
ncbi:ABC-type organic anion transporter ABCA8-like isoform X2 [Talpa occidentalis]|uniref:ABC-type organic anion transporter ABCA8-like isoform X2 n=1 Tax=Talpa occidentalis TaxID=50954 RepID=UPI00188EF498|nr:ABC-type organic anion transporter ABCA8-like isoform X2 [Talpa occidentalis]